MNYIIEPSWFYWLSVANAVSFIAFILFIIGMIVTIVCALWSIDSIGFRDTHKTLRKFTRICGAVVVLSIVVYIFVPDKSTLIEMQVAKFATYENAQWTVENVKSVVDYIIDAIESMK